MAITKENTVGALDGIVSYSVGILSVLFGLFLVNSSAILAVGGFIVLLLRLFVDGRRFLRELQRKDI